MLGSTSDAEDLVQETFLRAWRARESLRETSAVRSWLYRIATNVCLDELARRPRRALPFDVAPPADPTQPIAPAAPEVTWLEPAPDAWLGARENIALAFIAALQRLTPVQRAVLLLRDVADLSAAETADALGVTTSAANSALFRAREAARMPPTTPASDVDPALVARFVRAFESNDTQALVTMLRDDIRTTMPPSPTWIDGRAANAEFYRRMFERLWLGAVRLVTTAANGQLAFGFYRANRLGEPHELRAIEVITVVDSAIAQIDHFMRPALAAAFQLPASLP